jgi:hypothetical protein
VSRRAETRVHPACIDPQQDVRATPASDGPGVQQRRSAREQRRGDRMPDLFRWAVPDAGFRQRATVLPEGKCTKRVLEA